MSIATEITRLQGAKASIKTSIENKGVTVPSSAKLDDYDGYIDQITGGGGAIVEKSLNFYDYDGTLVASYSDAEIQTLTELPTAPNHSGDFVPLTFSEWNWTVAQIKDYKTACPEAVIDVGAIYYPTDNYTHLIVKPFSGETLEVLEIQSFKDTTGTIDWGDGSSQETFSKTISSMSHVYSSSGQFNITLINCTWIKVYHPMITGIRINTTTGIFAGSSTSASSQSLNTATIFGAKVTQSKAYYNSSLKFIALPSNFLTLGDSSIQSKVLKRISLPPSITALGALRANPSLERLCLPMSITSLGREQFGNCPSLKEIYMPGVTFLGQYCFSGNAFQKPLLKEGLQILGDSSYYSNDVLQEVTIPSSVTNIYNNCFWNCFNVTYIMKRTTPPALSSQGLGNPSLGPRIIIVPYSADHSILEAYKTADNWSTYASKIVEEPAPAP